MTYCTKCGTKNEDDANNCVNCGAALYAGESTGMEQRREWREKRKEDECFGLPRGGTIFALFIGLIIILVGLQQLLNIDIDLGPFAIIVVGLLFVAGAIYGLTRQKN